VLKIAEAKEATRPGGFNDYGVPACECLIVEGSVIGPSKRFLKLRKTLSGKRPKKNAVKEIVWA